jgi:hypothetical protein
MLAMIGVRVEKEQGCMVVILKKLVDNPVCCYGKSKT